MFDRYKKVLIFDTETTGLDPKEDRIIEFGMMVLQRESCEEKFCLQTEVSVLVKPHNLKLPEKITEITGITQEDLDRGGITEERLFGLIAAHFLKNQEETLLIAYNAGFDIAFVESLLSRYLFKTFDASCLMADILDPLTIFRDRHRGPHKLKDAIAYYGADGVNSHRAVDDVRALFCVLKKMALEKNNIDLYINHLGYNPYYGPGKNRIPRIHYIGQEGGQYEIEAHVSQRTNMSYSFDFRQSEG